MTIIPHLTATLASLLGETGAARARLYAFVVGVLFSGTVVLRRLATTQA